jgi:putative endonuclease
MDDRAGLGRTGEKHAERFLRREKKYLIVTRNYRSPIGEIDLVAVDGKTIVFVEVKTRTTTDHADPQDAVNAGKRERIARGAEYFLRQTRSEDRPCRFDILAITKNERGDLQVEHLLDAFTPER